MRSFRDRFIKRDEKYTTCCKETRRNFYIYQPGSATSENYGHFTRNNNTENFRKPYLFVRNNHWIKTYKKVSHREVIYFKIIGEKTCIEK